MSLVVILALIFATVNATWAESFVFSTGMAQLTIGSDGTARSLIEKQDGKEQLNPTGLPFAVVRKDGRLFPSSKIQRRGGVLHIIFGISGISADYRVTESAEYIVVELVGIHGEGIQEIRMIQLSTSLPNAGELLGVRWNDDFSLCLMALNERVHSEIEGSIISTSVYPEFSMLGQRVAIIAVPTSRFLKVVQNVELNFRLPSPTIDGTWAKLSIDARTNYLFTDLTETNADEMIRYAKMGGFRYILINSSTWSKSLGSYPINLVSFPHGEVGLKSVIDKCHASGLRVGIRMLTSLVGKDDPFFRAKPGLGLLKDGVATLAQDVNGQDTELTATWSSSPAKFSTQAGYYGTSKDILIDDEIIHYGQIKGTRFLRCERGVAGTSPSAHKMGATIQHLVERDDAYLADLRSPLASAISDRIAGLINRVGLDMVYFDGGELNTADGSPWYWVGVQQSQIWERSKRDLLVQGSGITGWTWHIFTRGTCDDYAAVAVKHYLDYHKIADSWHFYHDNFLPVDLGWVGLLQDAPDHSATTPDELEYYAVRMLALDSAMSLQTSLSALKENGRTEEMLKMLDEYKQLQLSNAVSKTVRQQLMHGEWHMTRRGEFHPVRYDTRRMTEPGETTLNNEFKAQPLKFRLQILPTLAAIGDPKNIILLQSAIPLDIPPPDSQDVMPGSLALRIELSKIAQNHNNAPTVPQSDRMPGNTLDLTHHRALAVQLEVEGAMQAAGRDPVLNIQLEADGNTYRDYYVDLDFRGLKTVVLPEPGTNRMLAEFRPSPSNYPFKAAMYNFNFGKVVSLNLRWMRYVNGSGIRCQIRKVEALRETTSVLSNFDIATGSMKISIPGKMESGDYAEYWGDRSIRIFNQNGVLLRTAIAYRAPVLKVGENKLSVSASGTGSVKLTAITLGSSELEAPPLLDSRCLSTARRTLTQ